MNFVDSSGFFVTVSKPVSPVGLMSTWIGETNLLRAARKKTNSVDLFSLTQLQDEKLICFIFLDRYIDYSSDAMSHR